MTFSEEGSPNEHEGSNNDAMNSGGCRGTNIKCNRIDGAKERHRRNQNQHVKNPTKITIHNSDNSWASLFRDIIIAFIPFFVLYKISTHPAISEIGRYDPNAPRKLSQEEILRKMMLSLYEKKRLDLQKDNIFFEAMNENQCYDYGRSVDGPVVLQGIKGEESGRKGVKRRPVKRRMSSNTGIKGAEKAKPNMVGRKGGKTRQKKHMNFNRGTKGAETAKPNTEKPKKVENEGLKRRPKKKQMGSGRRFF